MPHSRQGFIYYDFRDPDDVDELRAEIAAERWDERIEQEENETEEIRENERTESN